MGFRGVAFQLMLAEMLLTATLVSSLSKPGCDAFCGDLEIPYPFGTSLEFFISRRCHPSTEANSPWYNLPDFLTVSNTENKFTVIGCNSYAYIEGRIDDRNYKTGCISLSFPNVNQTNIPDIRRCTYAFVAEQSKFKFKPSYIFDNLTENFPMVLDWAITGNAKCEECKENTECETTEDGSGYRCKCKTGYEGNPYLSNSCQEGCLFEILENYIVNDGNEEQLKEVAELAKICLKVKGEERPTMREVAMELDGLRMMHKHSWVNTELNPEETEHLLRDTSDVYKCADGSSTSAGYDSIKDHVLVVFDDGR
ncbi:hypothetical protein Patl1_17140 [Pistacia atlantica]|uniref:Uncharacterized protein n=1 Tax=Pistacia atlantica TaxID=434234 RepID=A0ACC1B630_9ROSI|nr:hypothetical protein Patl1_17140 [Pistacia atlantica]